MARRGVPDSVGEAEKPDLTPMIDIVFNLIVFFMIVSELSNLEVEQLALARADQAEEVRGGRDAPGLVVNLLADGRVRARGRAWRADAGEGGEPPLRALLEAEVAGAPLEPGEDGARPCSSLELVIRADRDARFERVQQVFAACEAVGVFRTSLAADPAGGER